MTRFKDKKNSTAKFKAPEISLRYLHPVFCFKHVQNGFLLSDHNQEQMKQATKKLERWASADWQTIDSASRTGMGHEKISHDSINVSIPIVAKGKVIRCTRYHGNNCRLLGFIDSNKVFNILWFDKDLEVYDH